MACDEGCAEAGKASVPKLLQLHVSWARTEQEALDNAMREWPNGGMAFPKQDIKNPEDFAAMAKLVRPEDFKNRVLISADLEEHLAHVQRYVDMGFDEIHLHNVGRNQAEFIDAFGREVLPNLKLGGPRGRDPDGSGDVAGAGDGGLTGSPGRPGSPSGAWLALATAGSPLAPASLGQPRTERPAGTQTRPPLMRPVPRRFARAASAAFVVAGLVTALLPALPALAKGPIKVTGHRIETSVDHQRIVRLPEGASHVALAWSGTGTRITARCPRRRHRRRAAHHRCLRQLAKRPRRGGRGCRDRCRRATGRSRPDGAGPRASSG